MAVTRVPLHAFVRLKLRIIGNGLRGRPARIALFTLGAVAAGLLAVGGYAAFAVPGLVHSAQAAQILLPIGGAALVLGWLFLPLLFFGVDESLDPARFALLPLPRRTLLAGLAVAALAGLPALATLVATAGMVDTAARLGGPGAALTQLIGVVCGLLLCVAVSRAVSSALARMLRSRRSRELATVLLAVLAASLGPAQLLVWEGFGVDVRRLAAVAAALSWTPIGAPYSVGLDVAAGRWWAAPVKLLIVLVAIGGLLWWWGSTLETAMYGASGDARRGDHRTDGRGPVRQLLLRWSPRSRFGALVSREARYWWRETRRRAALITLSLAGLFLPISTAVGADGVGATWIVVMVGAMAPIALANQFGYEGSAYAANIVAGVPGRVEVHSRACAHALFVLPILLLSAVAAAVAAGRPSLIAAVFGLLIAGYGAGLSLVLPISVRAGYALPETSGPFALSVGGGMAKGLLAVGALFGALLGTLPLVVVGLLLGPAWSWVGLPLGLGYGLGAYAIGARLAGDLLDRRMPEVLAAVTAH